jgi:hypothetical protein
MTTLARLPGKLRSLDEWEPFLLADPAPPGCSDQP